MSKRKAPCSESSNSDIADMLMGMRNFAFAWGWMGMRLVRAGCQLLGIVFFMPRCDFDSSHHPRPPRVGQLRAQCLKKHPQVHCLQVKCINTCTCISCTSYEQIPPGSASHNGPLSCTIMVTFQSQFNCNVLLTFSRKAAMAISKHPERITSGAEAKKLVHGHG